MVKRILYVVVLGSILLGVWYKEHHYTMKGCEVIEATNTGCVIVDQMGQEWCWEGGGYSVGDIVSVSMWDNWSSAYIADDEIVKIKKE